MKNKEIYHSMMLCLNKIFAKIKKIVISLWCLNPNDMTLINLLKIMPCYGVWSAKAPRRFVGTQAAYGKAVFINALKPTIMKELEKILNGYDLSMIVELKESIDFTLSALDISTSVEHIQPLLIFNSILSEWLKDITEELDEENNFYRIVFDHLNDKK